MSININSGITPALTAQTMPTVVLYNTATTGTTSTSFTSGQVLTIQTPSMSPFAANAIAQSYSMNGLDRKRIKDLGVKESLFYGFGDLGITVDEIYEKIENSLILVQEFESGDYGLIDTDEYNDRLQEALKRIVLVDGQEAKIKLPDGSILKLNTDASYTIEDSHCKIQYRANRIREFNRFVEGSELLEDFMTFLKKCKFTKEQAMNQITLRHFIEWLIVEAAKADGEEVPDYYPTEKQIVNTLSAPHTCKYCNSELPQSYKQEQISFCNGNHMNLYMENLAYKQVDNHYKSV